jgi:UDP-N-acetylmuramoyl-L-alanyl-D-glutamate--2,6-diaminopimelate ligase
MDWTKAAPAGRGIGSLPASVTGATHDSRLVSAGYVFIAVAGTRSDGHDFIEAAIGAGAAAAVVQADREAKWRRFEGRVPLLVVPDSRAVMGPIAAEAYGRPSSRLRVVGVTGTDGKTTTTHLLAHVLDACGLKCGFLSSVGFESGRGFELNESHMTTLEATFIQERLARAMAAGRETMVVEASSEGLAQHRLAACEVDVAVFTNLTRDHLDFHGTMENYRTAKGRLFEMLDEATEKRFRRAAVLNADDAASVYMRGRSRAQVISYGIEVEADLRGSDIELGTVGSTFVVTAEGRRHAARTPLFGRFNVYNCLAALGVAVSQGVAVEDAIGALATFAGVPGRMEAIDEGQAFRVVVDIASTPAALETVLRALRPATQGRLWAVFGAAGGRDPARRSGMGSVAGRLADRAVLTNEDPRDEDADAIIEAIAAGMRAEGRTDGRDFVRLPDRRGAIAYAFAHAEAGDTVLLAGKATETSMIFAGGEARPWDELSVARELLKQRFGM